MAASMFSALAEPSIGAGSGSMGRKGIIAHTPLTPKQIRARKASKLARKARKVSRPTY